MTLYKLFIPKPCTEKWDNMQKTQEGKLCDLCSKEVIDFTDWTDSEIIQYFENIPTNIKGKTCGRLSKQQVERINQLLQNHASPKPNLWRIFAWAFSVSAFSSIVTLQNLNAAEKIENPQILIKTMNEDEKLNTKLNRNSENEIEQTDLSKSDTEIIQGEIEVIDTIKKTKKQKTILKKIKKKDKKRLKLQ
jgi:hypothetical protein